MSKTKWKRADLAECRQKIEELERRLEKLEKKNSGKKG